MNGSLHYALLCFVEYPFPDKGTDVPYLSIQSFIPDSALQKVALNITSLGLIIKYNCLSS